MINLINVTRETSQKMRQKAVLTIENYFLTHNLVNIFNE